MKTKNFKDFHVMQKMLNNFVNEIVVSKIELSKTEQNDIYSDANLALRKINDIKSGIGTLKRLIKEL